MRVPTASLFLAVLLLIAPAMAPAQEAPAQKPPAQEAPAQELPRSGNAVFDRAVDLTLEEFYDTAALDRFREAVREEIDDPKQPLAPDSPPDRVHQAIEAALASLNASHTGHFRPDSIAYFELADIFRQAIRNDVKRLFPPDGEVSYAGIGMVAEPIDGRPFVTHVYDGSPASRAGLLVGDEILAVDGKPYSEIESFKGKAGQKVEIRLHREKGAEPISVKVAVERLRPLQSFEKAIKDSVSVTERDGKRIGYVRLWTLSTREGLGIVAEEMATGRLKDADGLVIDLRGRWGGGSADAAELIVGRTPDFRLISRDGEVSLSNVRWRRPVVALTDDGTRSGLEVFAYALKKNGIPLVGARTPGALLAGRAYVLPDDSLLELAVADAVIGEDVRLEGRGIEPDIPVPFPVPYAAGHDPQREAATEEMRRMLAKD